MEYNMEKILPIVVWLTEKYTSKESSSVSYETAQMLMKAVIYTINEYLNQQDGLVPMETGIDERGAYDQGYELIVKKVRMAKALYEKIIEDFEDYDCMNYRDTIIKGIPAFFMKYDPRFQPQNHILTLDYPTLEGQGDLEGIDLIYEYLLNIRKEQRFLSKFGRQTVIQVLQEIQADYRELYLDNICYPLLEKIHGKKI